MSNKLYTTNEFMALTGIKFRSDLTKFAKRGIVKPIQASGRNYYTDQDLHSLLTYKSPEEALQAEIKQTSTIETRLAALEAAVDKLTQDKTS